MSDTDLKTEIEALGTKIDHVVNLLLAFIPRHKLPASTKKIASMAKTPDNALELRKKEMIRLLHAGGRDLDPETKSRQKYPVAISLGKMEVMPQTILIFRCSASKAFRPVAEFFERSAKENAETTLAALVEDGSVVVSSLTNSKVVQSGHRISSATCVFSRKYWDEIENPKKEEKKQSIEKHCLECGDVINLMGECPTCKKTEAKVEKKIEPPKQWYPGWEKDVKEKAEPKTEEHKPESFLEFKERIKREKEQANELADEICEECREDLVDGKCPNCKVIDL